MLEVKNFTKEYGDLVAVNNINIEIDDGEFATIVGPSGCGKTTTLKTIAGHLTPTEGSILYHGQDITYTKPGERPTCMVFQDWALFPHMTVRENVKFPLQNTEETGHEDLDARVDELLEQVELDPTVHGEKTPDGLSGGQKQRVAIARSLAYDPDILLLDEPLESLDYVLKVRLQRELADLQAELESTFVYVTHSLESALIMSDKLFVMQDGNLVQVGSPQEIYQRPKNRFVAEFMGDANVFDVVLEDQQAGEVTITGSEFDETFTIKNARLSSDQEPNYMVVRHDNTVLGAELDGDIGLAVEVYNVIERGNVAEVEVESALGNEYTAEMKLETVNDQGIITGTEGYLQWRSNHAVLIPE